MRAFAALTLAALALAAVPAAQAHGVFEAQELEIHVINDEGSDAIEAYGGYDVTEVFLGSAYVEGLGESVYVRLELYGLVEDQTALMPWSVTVRYRVGGQEFAHSLSTTDGQTFSHDFGAMEFSLEPAEHAVSIERAILTNGPPRPGQAIDGLTVESRWGDDLRDIAPGGIPVPGSNGALEYPEPTALPGRGRLVESPVPPPVDAYFGAVTAARDEAAATPTYVIGVGNGLARGEQHIHLKVPEGGAWTTRLDLDNVAVGANGTAQFRLEAAPALPGAAPLLLVASSDVGGRLLVELHEDGSVHARGAEVLAAAPPEAAKESPGLPLALALAAFAAVALRRRA